MKVYEDKRFNIRLEARLKNSELMKARESLGLNQKRAAELIGISPGSLSHYELLKTYPKEKMQEKICSAYKELGYFMAKNKVFPKQLKDVVLRNKLIAEAQIPVEKLITISIHQIDERLLPAVEPEVLVKIEKEELSHLLEEALSKLPNREKEITKLFYGIDTDRKYSLEEIGDKYHLTRERVRQIKEKVIKKLRFSSAGKELRNFKKY